MMAKISSWGISHILTGAEKPADTTIKRNIVNHEASVIDLIQENVSTAILKEIDDFATAREAWDYLALLYTVHNDCEKARWKAKLANFSIEDKEPAVEVFRRLMTIIKELKKQGVEETPGDQIEETFLEALTVCDLRRKSINGIKQERLAAKKALKECTNDDARKELKSQHPILGGIMVYTKRIQEEEDWLKMSKPIRKKGTIVLSTDERKG
eukprot:Pgem_evm1s9830